MEFIIITATWGHKINRACALRCVRRRITIAITLKASAANFTNLCSTSCTHSYVERDGSSELVMPTCAKRTCLDSMFGDPEHQASNFASITDVYSIATEVHAHNELVRSQWLKITITDYVRTKNKHCTVYTDTVRKINMRWALRTQVIMNASWWNRQLPNLNERITFCVHSCGFVLWPCYCSESRRWSKSDDIMLMSLS